MCATGPAFRDRGDRVGFGATDRPPFTDEDFPPMRLFISAGEPSGDVHAANLIRAIRDAPTSRSSASAART